MSPTTTPVTGTYQPRERDAVYIDFVPAADGSVNVDLRIPIGGDSEAERVARELWPCADGYLRVQSVMPLDLLGERHALVAHYERLYRDGAYKTLLNYPLEPVDVALAKRAMQPVAVAGRGVFASIFAPEEYVTPVEGFDERLQSVVLEVIRRPGRINVRSEGDPIFPWAFVYDDLSLTSAQGAGGVRLDRFWGFVHELGHEHDGTSVNVLLPKPPRVLASVCPTVDTAGVTSAPDHPLASLDPRWIDDVGDLREGLRALDCDAFYILGHAVHEEPVAPSKSLLRFDNTPIPVSELQGGGGPRGAENPTLLFHNACESAPIDRWTPATIPGFLLRRHKGRLCYLGTAAEVPRAVAMGFARGFWERFTGGSSAGASVLGARRALLGEYNNPLGLLYALHGKADTRIVKNGEHA